jgi:hypothetical protein
MPLDWEAENEKITVQGQPSKKLSRLHIKKESELKVHACNPNYKRERGGRTTV